MNDFAAFDQVLTQRFATPDSTQLLAPAMAPSDFRPLFAPGSHLGHSHAEGRQGTGGAPQVEMVQVEGRIERIIVTCGCGERIEIECEY